MVETVYTPDGKLHTLLGSCTIQEIVREYAGEDAAKLVENLVSKNARAEAIAKKLDSDKALRRAGAAQRIRLLKKQIESEL